MDSVLIPSCSISCLLIPYTQQPEILETALYMYSVTVNQLQYHCSMNSPILCSFTPLVVFIKLVQSFTDFAPTVTALLANAIGLFSWSRVAPISFVEIFTWRVTIIFAWIIVSQSIQFLAYGISASNAFWCKNIHWKAFLSWSNSRKGTDDILQRSRKRDSRNTQGLDPGSKIVTEQRLKKS